LTDPAARQRKLRREAARWPTRRWCRCCSSASWGERYGVAFDTRMTRRSIRPAHRQLRALSRTESVGSWLDGKLADRVRAQLAGAAGWPSGDVGGLSFLRTATCCSVHGEDLIVRVGAGTTAALARQARGPSTSPPADGGWIRSGRPAPERRGARGWVAASPRTSCRAACPRRPGERAARR
jgi:hypothetical protein